MDPSSQFLSLNSSIRTMASTVPSLHCTIHWQAQIEKQSDFYRPSNKLRMQKDKGDVQLTLSKFLTLQNNTTLSNWEITSRTDFW